MRKALEAGWREVYGHEYAWDNERDGRAARRLLRREDCCDLVRRALELRQVARAGERWHCAVTLPLILACVNELRASLRRTPLPPPACPCGAGCSPHCGLSQLERLVQHGHLSADEADAAARVAGAGR